MKDWIKYIVVILLGSYLVSCEDVIDIDTDNADALLTVDAWLNDLPEDQVIRLTKSQPYFQNEFAPAVMGASVSVISDDGEEFIFEDQGDGNYIWSVAGDSTLGKLGSQYTLMIDVEGRQISSVTSMQPVPVIDSIVQEFREDELGGPDGIYAQFFARDIPGLGNTYWIKTFKNGLFLNKPDEINLAYDGGFDAGAEIDDIIFIPPIREAVNPVPDSAEAENDVPPYEVGDRIRVEIHSISLEAFLFLEAARDQILNGSNTIFASPIANSPGNVYSVSDDQEVLGVFCLSSVSSLEKQIE